MKSARNNKRRRGSVAVFLCILTLPLLALLALSVDYGFLLFVRTDLQRCADLAALAAVRDLVPDENGEQDLDQVRATIREYVEQNLGEGFQVRDSDIFIGRFDPATIYTSFTVFNDGILDTVQVTVRRDDLANTSVAMYFARLFGTDESDVSATSTAVLQKARYLGPGTGVLPISMPESVWNSLNPGNVATVYGGGKIEDDFGNTIPGNFGTIDIGPKSNSTNDLNYQIENGLSQDDLDSLQSQGAIPSNEYIDSQRQMWLNGDTGFSAGIKHSIQDIEGQTRLIPIFDTHNNGNGNNLDYHITGWGVVELTDSYWKGNKSSYVKVMKTYMFDAHLRPNRDLSDLTNVIEGAYTSPVLVR